jgi:hypothetical protein
MRKTSIVNSSKKDNFVNNLQHDHIFSIFEVDLNNQLLNYYRQNEKADTTLYASNNNITVQSKCLFSKMD